MISPSDMKTTLPATLETVSTLKDGSFKMVFTSQELNSENGTTLLQMRQKFGWLLFSPNEITAEDVPEIEVSNSGIKKSASKRLRDCIFIWWKNQGQIGEFEDFYQSKIERIIGWVKEKI